MVAVAVDYSIDKVCFGLEQREEIQVRMCGQMIYVYTDFAQYTVRYVCLIYIYKYVCIYAQKERWNAPVAFHCPTTDDFLLCMRQRFRRSMRHECISTTKSMKRKHQNLGFFYSKMGGLSG